MNLADLQPKELFQLHADIMEELYRRKIVRSSNNPTGDLAERLFCEAFKWTQENNSNANFDAIDPACGAKYQIKARRVTPRNPSRQLSAIRDLAGGHFQFVAGVLFDERYAIKQAAFIPHGIIAAGAKFVPKTNSHKFMFRNKVMQLPGVVDVTDALRAVWY